MPRITRDGVTYHPDQLDPMTGEPLGAPATAEPELSPAQAATRELLEIGAEQRGGNWWALEIDGDVHKAQGAEHALEVFRRP